MSVFTYKTQCELFYEQYIYIFFLLELAFLFLQYSAKKEKKCIVLLSNIIFHHTWLDKFITKLTVSYVIHKGLYNYQPDQNLPEKRVYLIIHATFFFFFFYCVKMWVSNMNFQALRNIFVHLSIIIGLHFIALYAKHLNIIWLRCIIL